jgi:hypothetical protein
MPRDVLWRLENSRNWDIRFNREQIAAWRRRSARCRRSSSYSCTRQEFCFLFFCSLATPVFMSAAVCDLHLAWILDWKQPSPLLRSMGAKATTTHNSRWWSLSCASSLRLPFLRKLQRGGPKVPDKALLHGRYDASNGRLEPWGLILCRRRVWK